MHFNLHEILPVWQDTLDSIPLGKWNRKIVQLPPTLTVPISSIHCSIIRSYSASITSLYLQWTSSEKHEIRRKIFKLMINRRTIQPTTSGSEWHLRFLFRKDNQTIADISRRQQVGCLKSVVETNSGPSKTNPAKGQSEIRIGNMIMHARPHALRSGIRQLCIWLRYFHEKCTRRTDNRLPFQNILWGVHF